MKKLTILSAVAIVALAACSEDNGANTSAVQEPLTKGQSAMDVSLSESDITFMNGLLDSFVSSSAIRNNLANDNDSLTDDIVIQPSVALFHFNSEEKVIYRELKNSGSCSVNLYSEENGIQFSKYKREKNPEFNTYSSQDVVGTILFKENGSSLYRQDLRYISGTNCVADSTLFVSKCNEDGGIFKIYGGTCASSLETSCVVKTSNQVTLESIADSLKVECESHIANLPDEDTIPSVYCIGDSENGMVCDTISNE